MLDDDLARHSVCITGPCAYPLLGRCSASKAQLDLLKVNRV